MARVRKIDLSKYEYFTKENKEKGLFPFCLYGWGTHSCSSVLAGQAMKCYLDGFETKEELEAFMVKEGIEGNWSNQWLEPQPSYSHLSDGPDVDAHDPHDY